MKSPAYIPKVKFELAPVEMEAEWLYFFSRTERRFDAIMHRVYPELGDALSKSHSKDEDMLICQEFAEQVMEKNRAIILTAKNTILDDWNMIGNEFLRALSTHFETEWPTDRISITGYVSIVPIFPRFLDKYSFCVGHKVNTAQAREIIAHEILHLLWFKKWKEVFPEISVDQYESPHLAWRLSEIMDPIILQCNPIIKKLIKPAGWGYECFKTIKIGDVGMTEYFVKSYAKCVSDGRNFGEMLQTLWMEAQGNKKVLEVF